MSTNERDEELFKQPPKADDCPVCYHMLPCRTGGQGFMACCGKFICSGCTYAWHKEGRHNCPYCRAKLPETVADCVARLDKRVEANDSDAMSVLGQVYLNGHDRYGGGQDQAKGMKLLLRASELGSVSASSTLADMYSNGIYVARDCKKTTHYLELAAKGGNAHARYYLGLEEMFLRGKIDRAIKHWMLACEGGHPGALQGIRNCYTGGTASKADYEKALRSYQQYLDDVKSSQRDEAAAYGYVYLLSTDDFNA